MSDKKRFVIGGDFAIKSDKLYSMQEDKKKFPLEKHINIGYYLVTPLLLGVFLGLAVDKFLKTKPVFTIFFIIIGTASTFYNLYKATKIK